MGSIGGMMNGDGKVRSRRHRKRLLQVKKKRAIKRYVMIALIMGTVGFLMMLVEEAFDQHEKPIQSSGFEDDQTPPSIFSSDRTQQRKKGDSSSQGLDVEQLKKMKKAAEMLGIVK